MDINESAEYIVAGLSNNGRSAKDSLIICEKAIEILQKILTYDPNHTQSKKSIHNLVKMLERRKNALDKSKS